MHLVEDRPPVNITSPGSVPIDLSIGKMRMTRDETGRFQIQPHDDAKPCGDTDATTTSAADGGQRKDRDRELLSLQLVMQQLKMDNEQLKRQLRNTEKSSETIKLVLFFVWV